MLNRKTVREELAGNPVDPNELDAIIATDQDFLIGFNAAAGYRLPWPNMRDDMAFFRSTTAKSLLLMGRKTLQGIGCLLPGRISLVFSWQPELRLSDQVLCQSTDLDETRLRLLLGAHTAGLLLRGWEDYARLNATGMISPSRPRLLIGGAGLLGEAWCLGLLNKLYFTQVQARLSAGCRTEEEPVYLPSDLRQNLRRAMAVNTPIRSLEQNHHNSYAAHIYCIYPVKPGLYQASDQKSEFS